MHALTIREMARMHAADLRADAGPVRRRPRRRRIRRAMGVGLIRTGYRLLGARGTVS